MSNATLTSTLPSEEADSLKSFAVEHGLTVAELGGRFAQGLKSVGPVSIHPEVLALTGLVPSGWDVEIEHRQYLLTKHR